jgi:hypothetical protein
LSILKDIAEGATGGLLGGMASLINSIRGAITGKEALKSEDITKVQELLSALEMKILDLRQKLIDAQQAVIVAEAQGESWLQRNWRPLTMLVFLSIILYQAIFVSIFNAPPINMDAIPPQMWTLLQIGIGGYITSRGVEKSVKTWKGKD